MHYYIRFPFSLTAPYTMFEFSVQAENSVGPGQFSPVRVFSTAEFGELNSPALPKTVYTIETPNKSFELLFRIFIYPCILVKH